MRHIGPLQRGHLNPRATHSELSGTPESQGQTDHNVASVSTNCGVSASSTGRIECGVVCRVLAKPMARHAAAQADQISAMPMKETPSGFQRVETARGTP